jgi:hypothetical protein
MFPIRSELIAYDVQITPLRNNTTPHVNTRNSTYVMMHKMLLLGTVLTVLSLMYNVIRSLRNKNYNTRYPRNSTYAMMYKMLLLGPLLKLSMMSNKIRYLRNNVLNYTCYHPAQYLGHDIQYITSPHMKPSWTQQGHGAVGHYRNVMPRKIIRISSCVSPLKKSFDCRPNSMNSNNNAQQSRQFASPNYNESSGLVCTVRLLLDFTKSIPP